MWGLSGSSGRQKLVVATFKSIKLARRHARLSRRQGLHYTSTPAQFLGILYQTFSRVFVRLCSNLRNRLPVVKPCFQLLQQAWQKSCWDHMLAVNTASSAAAKKSHCASGVGLASRARPPDRQQLIQPQAHGRSRSWPGSSHGGFAPTTSVPSCYASSCCPRHQLSHRSAGC